MNCSSGEQSEPLTDDELTKRHWDTWRVPGRVWTVGMTKIHKGINGFMEKPQQFINLLNGTGLVSHLEPRCTYG
jgi:hypothetical protein